MTTNRLVGLSQKAISGILAFHSFTIIREEALAQSPNHNTSYNMKFSLYAVICATLATPAVAEVFFKEQFNDDVSLETPGPSHDPLSWRHWPMIEAYHCIYPSFILAATGMGSTVDRIFEVEAKVRDGNLEAHRRGMVR